MKITISNPCQENWENMTIDEQGRFCAACSKTIHDFTDFSDEELVNSLGSDENICGRFRGDQLGRNLNFSLTSKIALGLLATGGALTTVNGQELKGEEVKKMDFKKGIDGVEVINKTLHKTMWLGMPTKEDIESTQPVILLDGKRISEEKMKKIDGDKVKRIKVLSGEGAVKLYGKLGQNGIIIIESKKQNIESI